MPKYAEEILAAVTELQQRPTAEQVFLEMKRFSRFFEMDAG